MNQNELKQQLDKLPSEVIEHMKDKALDSLQEIDNWHEIIQILCMAAEEMISAIGADTLEEKKLLACMITVIAFHKTLVMEPKTSEAFIFANRYYSVFKPMLNAAYNKDLEKLKKVVEG